MSSRLFVVTVVNSPDRALALGQTAMSSRLFVVTLRRNVCPAYKAKQP